MSGTIQDRAINATRSVLFSDFNYNANKIIPSDMFVVWSCKTLQNWKAIVSGVHVKELIEVTYNGDKDEIYVDVYEKKRNTVISYDTDRSENV
jgi:conserved domain protein